MRKNSEEGQALVEVALMVPLLCLLLFGAFEIGRAAYAAIVVSNAAKAAVQYAASSHSAAQDAEGIANAAGLDSQNLLGSNAVKVTSVATVCSCADGRHTPSSCSDNSTCQDNGSFMLERVTVRTQAVYSPVIRYFGYPGQGILGPKSYTLYGQATQMVQNQ